MTKSSLSGYIEKESLYGSSVTIEVEKKNFILNFLIKVNNIVFQPFRKIYILSGFNLNKIGTTFLLKILVKSFIFFFQIIIFNVMF